MNHASLYIWIASSLHAAFECVTRPVERRQYASFEARITSSYSLAAFLLPPMTHWAGGCLNEEEPMIVPRCLRLASLRLSSWLQQQTEEEEEEDTEATHKLHIRVLVHPQRR